MQGVLDNLPTECYYYTGFAEWIIDTCNDSVRRFQAAPRSVFRGSRWSPERHWLCSHQLLVRRDRRVPSVPQHSGVFLFWHAEY